MTNGYAICLNEWIFDVEIKNELPLLLYISSLCAKEGFCFANNDHLAQKFQTTEETISRRIKKLKSKGYIELTYQRRGAEVVKRKIRLTKMSTDDYQKRQPTIDENVKDNNTSINNNIISPISPFSFSPLKTFSKCECGCKRKAKVEINNKKYCGQHGRMELERLGKFEFIPKLDNRTRKKKAREYEDLSKEEQHGLYVHALLKDKAVQFERFVNSHISKGNKYKDWKRAYNTWLLNQAQWYQDDWKQRTPKLIRADFNLGDRIETLDVYDCGLQQDNNIYITAEDKQVLRYPK